MEDRLLSQGTEGDKSLRRKMAEVAQEEEALINSTHTSQTNIVSPSPSKGKLSGSAALRSRAHVIAAASIHRQLHSPTMRTELGTSSPRSSTPTISTPGSRKSARSSTVVDKSPDAGCQGSIAELNVMVIEVRIHTAISVYLPHCPYLTRRHSTLCYQLVSYSDPDFPPGAHR